MNTIRIAGGRFKINILLIFVMLGLIVLGMWDMLIFYIPALIIHELAHMVAAGACGIIIDDVEILPFGCTAKVKSFTALSALKEVFTAAAGPAVNIVLAAGIFFIDKYYAPLSIARQFITANLTIAAINLLPALPLDGGHIVRALLARSIGQKKATKICAIFGVVISSIMLLGGVFMVIKGYFNRTFFFMAVFLLYAAIKEIKNVPYTVIRDISSKRKLLSTQKAVLMRGFAIMDNNYLRDVLKEFDAGKYNVVYILDDDMRILKSLSETQVMDAVLKYGLDVKIKTILSKI
ncbi:MAG: M50 family metallopeptidase [Eubacteriales bacterium]